MFELTRVWYGVVELDKLVGDITGNAPTNYAMTEIALVK